MIFKQIPTMISDLNKLGIALKSLDAMKIGTVGVNISNVEAYRTALKGLSIEQSVLALASKGATEEQIRQILIINEATANDVEAAMAKAGLTTATKALTQAEMVEIATKSGVAKAEAEELLRKIGIAATEEGQVVVKKQVTLAMLEQAVASGNLTAAESAQIAAMLGLNAVESANIGITNVLTASFTKLWAVITAHPLGAILTAIGAVAVGTIAYINKTNKDAQKAVIEAHETAQQALEDSKTSLSDDKSELQDVNSKLETTKQRIQEISSLDTPTLVEQNELNKLSTTNAQLEIQKTLLENNIKLKQKSAALDAKELLGTQVEMEYSDILDESSIKSHKESYSYKEHAQHQASNLKNAYNIYMKALKEGDLKKQQLAQELINASAGDSATLTSELLEIVESFKYEDGTIIEGYEQIYDEYMGFIYNLQSLTNPDTFLEIAKSVTSNTGIDYEKVISDAYKLAFDGNFDIDKLNENFVKALSDAGIDESTIDYIFSIKQQEYQLLVDKINEKYKVSPMPDKMKQEYWDADGNIHSKYIDVDEEIKKQIAEVNTVNEKLNEYAKENPIKFQLVSSFDENFELLDKFIEEERVKAENTTDYVGDYIVNAIKRVYDEAKVQSSTLNNETGNSILSSSDFLNKFETQYKPALSAIQSSINQVMEATENGIKLKVDSESAINAISDIRNAVDEINNSEEIDFNIDTRSVDEFSDKLMNALDSGDLNAVKQAYTDFANDVVNSMQDMFGDINESNMQAAQKALESVGVLNAEQIIAEKTGYSYEDYAAAKQAAANSGIDLNGSVEEVAAQLKEEGLMATEDAKALMEYVIKKAAASGKAIDVSGAIAALAKEWEWLQKLIDQWGRYNSVSQKGMKGWGNTNGTEALGAGMYTPSVVGKPIEVETEVDVDLKWPNLDSSAKSAGSKAGKSFKDGLKEQLSDLDSVISGITSRIDDNIESVRTQKEEAVAAIDAQIDALNEQKSALEDQKKALEEERDARIEVIEQQKKQLELAIKAIDKQIKQKEKVIKGIQDEINSLKNANEQRKLQLNLQREQYELERLQQQRTILQYSAEKGMHYVQDTKSIRDQKEKVDDAKLEIEIAKKQQQIDLIEKEIDLLNEKKEAINEQIEILDEQKDQINEFYDKQIKAIDKQIEAIDKQIEELQKQKEETEKYYESLIENMEKSKSKYEELTELVGKAELSAKLKQLGIDEEALVNGSEEEFQKLKNAYLDVVFQLNSGNKDVLVALQELSGYNGTAPAMLDDSNTKLGTMNDELGNANKEVGNVNTSLGNTASTTGKVSDNIGDLSDKTTGLGDSLQEVNSALKNIPDSSSKIGDIAKSYGELATSLQSKEGSELDTQIGNINDSLSKIPEANSKIDPIVTSYKDLKDSLTGEDGASTNDKLEDINDVLDEIPNVSQSVTDIAEAYEKLSGSLTSEENVGLGKELSEINKELDVVPEPTNVTETALAYEKLDKAVVGNSDVKISGEIGNINTALGETPEPTNINNVTTAINELSVSIDKSKQSMDALSEAELNVNNNANDIAISIQSIVDNIQSAYENVETLRDGLSETNTFVVEEQIAFDILRQKIDEVVEVITEKISATYDSKSATETSISTELEYYILLKEKLLEVKESLDSINEAISLIDAMPINNLTSAFQLLYDKLLLVSNLLGVGMEGAEEGAVSGIAGAIQALNEISLEEGIIAQFTMLKEAIDSVTAAISGGGGESSEGEGSGGGSGSKGGQSGGKGGKGSQGKGESGGGNSLTGAIKEMGETAKEVIGEPDAEGDGTVIGEFGSMETAVNDVRDAIGTEGSEGGEGGSGGKGETDDTLVGSIEYLGDKTEEEMGELDGEGILGKFNEFKCVIEEAANQVKSISEGLDEIDGKEVECTITINVKMNGSIPHFASGTVLGNMQIESATYNARYGKAFASGTIGLRHDEKNALRSEYGQPELTVYPNGMTELTTSPVMSDLPKGTVIYNEEETKKIMDNKSNSVGNAHANGTDDGIWTTLADGTRVRELQPGDRMYDMMQKFDAYFNSMDGNIEKLVPNSVYEHQRQMEDMAKQINYVSSVVNNNRNVQQPVHNEIHITCPGVTSEEVAQQVGVKLNNMFSGLHLEAMQQSMKR